MTPTRVGRWRTQVENARKQLLEERAFFLAHENVGCWNDEPFRCSQPNIKRLPDCFKIISGIVNCLRTLSLGPSASTNVWHLSVSFSQYFIDIPAEKGDDVPMASFQPLRTLHCFHPCSLLIGRSRTTTISTLGRGFGFVLASQGPSRMHGQLNIRHEWAHPGRRRFDPLPTLHLRGHPRSLLLFDPLPILHLFKCCKRYFDLFTNRFVYPPTLFLLGFLASCHQDAIRSVSLTMGFTRGCWMFGGHAVIWFKIGP
jgi:hypothetical protein